MSTKIEPDKITFDEGSAPAAPAANKVALYAKSDGLLYSKDDAGTETPLGPGSAVQNAGATPSIQAGLASARPAFGTAGRLYLSTDTQEIERDTGSGWVLFASIALADLTGTLSDAQHGNRGGGTLHSAATTSTAGFQSAADKAKQDAYPAISGLTTGQVLRASGASAVAFTALVAADLPTATTAAQGAVRVGNDLAISGTILNLNKGTAFPGSPAAGDFFWRTDYTPYRLYRYTGSAWELLAGSMYTRVHNSADLTLTNNTTTALTFNSERDDTDAFHSTSSNTDRITFPVAGVYAVGGGTRYDTNGTGVRTTYIELNGVTIIALDTKAAISGTLTDFSLATAYRFAANDYVRLIGFQTSGGNLAIKAVGNFSPEFWAYRLGG